MSELEGEYWTFSAECNKPLGYIPRAIMPKCKDELDPEICMDCQFCMLTYAPDVVAFTPDFQMED